MNEAHLKLNGKWVYLYRSVDTQGNTIDFFLKSRRNALAAKVFFKKAFQENGHPDKVTIDKRGGNKATLDNFNKDIAKEHEIEIRQIKYLNNTVEQDHRFIKNAPNPYLDLRIFTQQR